MSTRQIRKLRFQEVKGPIQGQAAEWTRNQAFFQTSVPLVLSGHVHVFKFIRNS